MSATARARQHRFFARSGTPRGCRGAWLLLANSACSYFSLPTSTSTSGDSGDRRISLLKAALSQACIPWIASGVTPLFGPGVSPLGSGQSTAASSSWVSPSGSSCGTARPTSGPPPLVSGQPTRRGTSNSGLTSNLLTVNAEGTPLKKEEDKFAARKTHSGKVTVGKILNPPALRR